MWVVVNQLRKPVQFIPTKAKEIAHEITDQFVDELMQFYIPLKDVVCDRDSKFTSNFWVWVFKKLDTILSTSSLYHPQSNGQIERVNEIIEDIFQIYLVKKPAKQKEYLPLLEVAYNKFKHTRRDVVLVC